MDEVEKEPNFPGWVVLIMLLVVLLLGALMAWYFDGMPPP